MERFSLEDECRHYKAKNPPDIQRQFDEENGFFPAYDLSFLLDKLPQIFRLTHRYFKWYAQYRNLGRTHIETEADTPVDAACLLCVKLFETNILKKGVN